MDRFYYIVVTIALIILVVVLIGLGVLLQKQDDGEVFPPVQNQCPDGWTKGVDGKCTFAGDNKNLGSFKPNELNEMLPMCDFVVNCLPSSPDTQKIFSSDQFAAMKSSAMFINVGRGESVDEDSLANALSKEEILCAALDTTDPEPLDSNSPLWTLENCFITPHDSAWGPRAPLRAVELFIDNFKRLQDGKKLLNQV